MDCVYKIGNDYLYVYCEICEYVNDINNWMLPYSIVNIDYDKYIKIYNDRTIYKFNDKEIVIGGKIVHTDLYPLFYNGISNIINSDLDMFCHSCVLCYNDVGILIYGDFSSGKTSLCLKSLDNGFRLLSTDQSHLRISNGVLKFINGSRYMRVRGDKDIVIDSFNDDIEIKFIINLMGVSDNGKVRFDVIKNKSHVIKTLFKYFTWHSDIPLFTDNSLLDIDRIMIKKWLGNIGCSLYNVRGDIKKIIKKIKGELI